MVKVAILKVIIVTIFTVNSIKEWLMFIYRERCKIILKERVWGTETIHVILYVTVNSGINLDC